ncbi:hypothetical protein [Nocardioides sp. SYSU DS0651]|uniref:hypothetical protein n=1 Tax=Nocardioides sp. SYSU DS0651 TaxID=3415955 RepID=UPI003F4BB77F
MSGAVGTALVPGVPALLPEHASIDDPVAALRAACLAAVGELGPRVRVVAAGRPGSRVGAALVAAVGAAVVDRDETGVLVVGNGSARRTEQAPGHLDERAEHFDAGLRAALTGDLTALGLVDAGLARELWADTDALVQLPAVVPPGARADVRYDDAPFGVQYWVIRWGGRC